MTILADSRWRGRHGIGRFAAEVLPRLGPYTPVPGTLPVLHPLEPAWLSLMLRRVKPSVYFSPGFNPPLWSDCPLVFVVHDLIHLKISAETSPTKRFYYEKVVKPAVRRASRVLTVSAFSKSDLLEWSGVSEERVVVVGNGISKAFRYEGLTHTGGCPYFLFVGARKPHKNLVRVLEAFARSGLARNARLLLTGDPEACTSKVAEQLHISRSIEFIGQIEDGELAAYYRGAVALLAPSLYEGFCLPALEAMACGCPVIAARAGAQPEVLGDAGLYVDPLRVDEISAAMLDISAGRARQAFIARGLRQARFFSWEQTAGMVRAALLDAEQIDRSPCYAEVSA